MHKCEVNEKYVLALVENADSTLSVKQMDIPSSEIPIAELQAMAENPNRTVYDMSSYFYSTFSPQVKAFAFCYPDEYNKSYVEMRSIPTEISYSEYCKKVRDFENDFEKRYHYNKKSVVFYKEKLETEVKRFNESLKKEYFKKASIYIKCLRLSETINQIVSLDGVRLFSRDIVGFSTFRHQINNDISVELKTNFGYGSAAYFNLAVKYKDIVILPYSYLIHYYYANMKSLMACTRAYCPLRASWQSSINFIADFVNRSINDPRQFIGEYVLHEIEEMMKGLRAIMDNPSEIQNRIKESAHGEIRLSVIRPFNEDEFVMMETMSDELTTLFKCEKISGALLFIESLQGLQEVCGDMMPVIDEILSMNKEIKPEIPLVLEKVRSFIAILQKEVRSIERGISFKEKRKLYFDRHKERLEAKMTIAEKITHDKVFREKNPLYVKLENEINELNDHLYKVSSKILRRQRVEERLLICLKRSENLDE